MTNQEIYKYLKSIQCCNRCCLRYIGGWKEDFNTVEKSILGKKISIIEDNEDFVCPACLNLLSESTITSAVDSLMSDEKLNTYECDKIVCAIQFPIILNLRQLSIWFGLLNEFPSEIDNLEPPDISVKEVFKYILNPRVCEATKKEFDPNGIMVNFYFDSENESEELMELLDVKPGLFNENEKKRKKHNLITRNIFEKHFIPKQLSFDLYKSKIDVPPKPNQSKIKLTNHIITGPTVFVAGRYSKFSRHLSQSPWVLDGKRVMEDSVQEIIINELIFHFGVDPEKIIFSASGREDVDVRCLGNGRPFVLEIIDSHSSTLANEIAQIIENNVNNKKEQKVTIKDVQMVKREDLVHIKQGEEHKKKIYRALCKVDSEITLNILKKLDFPDGFLIHQCTPLRVLHRRTLLSRPRQVYSVSPKYYRNADGHEMLIIDIVTQAGTYIKELVHGDFGRTEPNFSSIVGVPMDIIALDVIGIDLDWPPPVLRS